MKKNIIIVVGVLLLVGGAFYGGMQYASRMRQANFQGRGNFFGQAGQVGGGSRMARNGGGFVAGEILSRDDKSITMKLPDGGSRIVFLSNTTQVMKSTTGSASDLATGEQITVMGTQNSDGSMSAASIQIRPLQTGNASSSQL